MVCLNQDTLSCYENLSRRISEFKGPEVHILAVINAIVEADIDFPDIGLSTQNDVGRLLKLLYLNTI